ncbi:MAG: Holliday junction branch migration protein RuvA [Candidatus Aminicenantes bacterium]|nr:Holliday junction branch migration protein RuvA [Candidatus Aminicenantes bacterium]
MIAYLKGRLIQKSPQQIVIDVDGVGYCAHIPLSTYFKLGEENELVELYIYTHLSDSTLALYGFSTFEERELFLKLISISGIGPKLALNVLSGMEPEELRQAIQESNVARLARIPGIGKKTALRIAMELQEKIEKKEKLLVGRAAKEKDDLISALVNLGFRRREIEGLIDEVIKSLTPEVGFEKLLRECLRRLAKI